MRQSRARKGLNNTLYLLHEATLSRLEVVAILPNSYKPTKRVKQIEEIEAYVPNKGSRYKTQEKDLNGDIY